MVPLGKDSRFPYPSALENSRPPPSFTPALALRPRRAGSQSVTARSGSCQPKRFYDREVSAGSLRTDQVEGQPARCPGDHQRRPAGYAQHRQIMHLAR